MALFGKETLEQTTIQCKDGLEELTMVYINRHVAMISEKKDSLRKQIAEMTKDLRHFDEDVIDQVDVEQFNHTSDILGIKATVVNAHVLWDKFNSKIVVTMQLEDLDDVKGHMRALGKYKYLPLSTAQFNLHQSMKDDLEELNVQFNSCVSKERNIVEKTAEVRAKLFEIRLRESGVKLIDNVEVNQLIQL